MSRIGLIGLGFMGRMHLAAYGKLPQARIVAVADSDPKRASGDLSGGWGNIAGAVDHLDMAQIKGTTDWRALLAMPDVEVVDICLPTPAHLEVAVAALASGKHVICEKPLALTSGDARKIANAAHLARGYFMPAMCMRFWPQWTWLKEAVADGRYGRVLGAAFRRVASMPPGWFQDGAQSGGAILDLHIHDTDYICWLFGLPKAVYSQGYTKTSGRIDHVVTQYLYEKGPAVVAEGSWCMAEGFAFSCRCTLNFEKATADFDMGREPALTVHREGRTEPVTLPGDGYSAELGYFLKCVAQGEAPTLVTAQDAVESIRVVEAEQSSIQKGTVVEL